MEGQPDARGRAAIRWLLPLVLGLAATLLALWALARPAPAPARRDLADRLAALDWARAADAGAANAAAREAGLGAALLPGDEALLAQLLRLQAESAHLALGPVRFQARALDGALQPVGVEIELLGPYYELPIFLDGLYRQRHLVEVERLTLESDGVQTSALRCRVEARFVRPGPTPDVTPLLARADLDAVARPFAGAALEDAARALRYERFAAHEPALARRSQANHHLVMRTLPRLTRQLAASPLGWAAASFTDGEARLTTEQP